MTKFVKCEGFDEALNVFVEKSQEVIREYYGKNYPNVPVSLLETEEKSRYVMIWEKGLHYKNAWAFVEKETGDILKPASFRVPAKHARGNIFSDKNGLEALNGYQIRYMNANHDEVRLRSHS